MSERDPIIKAELNLQREQAMHRDVYGEDMNNTKAEKTVNQLLAEFMGLCWHEFGPLDVCCEKCGTAWVYITKPNPAYDSEESPRSLLNGVEAKVIETVGWSKYLDSVWLEMFGVVEIGSVTEQLRDTVNAIIAPAHIRAAACRACIEGEGK